MNTPATLHERLKLAMSHRVKTHAQLAELLGKARSAVTHWCSGRSEPELEDVSRAADALGVRRGWLAFGDGEMVDGPATDPADAPDDAPTLRAPVVVRDGFDQSAEATVATASELDGTPPLERAEPTRSSKAPRRGGAAAA